MLRLTLVRHAKTEPAMAGQEDWDRVLEPRALVAEYFGGPQKGLGPRIASSAANTAYGRAWAYVVAAIVVGLLFYLAVLLLERLATPWTGRARSV